MAITLVLRPPARAIKLCVPALLKDAHAVPVRVYLIRRVQRAEDAGDADEARVSAAPQRRQHRARKEKARSAAREEKADSVARG